MVVSLFFFIVELSAIFCALFYTLTVHPNIKKVTLGILLIGIPTIFSYLYVLKLLGFIYLVVSMILFFYFYTRKLRVLLDVFMLFIACIVSENISQIIRFTFFSMDSIESGTDIPKSAAIFLLFFVFFVYLYSLFVKIIWNVITMSIFTQLLLIIIAWITVSILYLNLFISLNRNLYFLAMFNLVIETIYFSLMCILSVILFRNVKKENRIKQKEIEQEQLFQYMQALEQINRDMQGFRHDYKNILLTMQGYINQNDMDGLRSYFNDRIVKVEKQTLQNNYIFNQLDSIKLVELKGLISTKVLLAEESNIYVNVEVPDAIKTIEMNIIDLTRIVGIIMDNAIEASKIVEMEIRKLNVAIFQEIDGSILIVFENRVDQKLINIEQLFKAGYSTKGKDHGQGLTIVRRIINQYPNITLNTRLENSFFIQEIEIKATIPKEYASAFYTKTTA